MEFGSRGKNVKLRDQDLCNSPIDETATELQKWQYKSLLPAEKICEKRSQTAVATSAPQFPRSIVFAAGFSWRDQKSFYPIPKDSKMTGEVFIESVLRPILFRSKKR